MQRTSGSHHLQRLPRASTVSDSAPQLTPASANTGSHHAASDVHQHSPTANLAAALARAAHDSPALHADPDSHAHQGMKSSAKSSTVKRADSAQHSKAAAGVHRPAAEPSGAEGGLHKPASSAQESSSSSASFDSWRLDGQMCDHTDTASMSQANASPMQMGTSLQPSAMPWPNEVTAHAMPQMRESGARSNRKEGWTDRLISQVQQSGLVPGRQYQQLGLPHKPLHAASSRQTGSFGQPHQSLHLGAAREDVHSRDKPMQAGRVVLLGMPLTPMSAQGSTSASPIATERWHALSPASHASRNRGPPAVGLSPLASALAHIR